MLGSFLVVIIIRNRVFYLIIKLIFFICLELILPLSYDLLTDWSKLISAWFDPGGDHQIDRDHLLREAAEGGGSP